MYKKITHNITEEHFAHPAIIPNHVTDKKIVTMGQLPMGQLPMGQLPAYVMNDVTMLMRMDARSAWGKWAWSLFNYAISLNGNLPGTPQVKARLNKNAALLGEFIIPYYGLTAGRLLSTGLMAIGDVGVEYINAIKEGQPTEAIIAEWEPLIDSLVTVMNQLNPAAWPKTLLSDIMHDVVKTWIELLRARAVMDLVADEIAIDHLDKIVITGLPDHIKHGFSSLADIFSGGIIAQFPQMFAD
jgi:hypothetical protein